jgi:hypothetical protein
MFCFVCSFYHGSLTRLSASLLLFVPSCKAAKEEAEAAFAAREGEVLRLASALELGVGTGAVGGGTLHGGGDTTTSQATQQQSAHSMHIHETNRKIIDQLNNQVGVGGA